MNQWNMGDMMNWMMDGCPGCWFFGFTGFIISILVIVVLILLAVYLWKLIQKK